MPAKVVLFGLVGLGWAGWLELVIEFLSGIGVMTSLSTLFIFSVFLLPFPKALDFF